MPGPADQIMLQQLMRQIGGGAPSGMPPGPPMSPSGQAVQSGVADVNRADPGKMLQDMNQIKGAILKYFTQSAFSLPEVSKHLGKIIPYLDQAIKAAGTAQQTANVIQGPIANNAGIQGMQPTQANPTPVPGMGRI